MSYPVLGSVIIDIDEYVSPFGLRISKNDMKPLFSKKGMENLERRLSLSPYKFNFIFTNKFNKGSFHIGPMNKERCKEFYPDIDISNSITMVLSSNVTNRKDYKPFTPWILIHRLGHATSNVFHCGNHKHDAIEFSARYITRRLFWEIYRIPNQGFRKLKKADITKIKTDVEDLTHRFTETKYNVSIKDDLCTSLFTMNSARTNHISTIFDIGAECLAQYVITGKIRLNRIEDWNQKLLNHPHLKIHGKRQIYINNLIEKYEIILNRVCEASLNSMVGKVFRF